MEENVIHVGLVAGRHALPVEGYVWKEAIPDPTDFQLLESQASAWIEDVSEHDLGMQPVDTVYLYITGLTACTTSFLNAWNRLGHNMANNLVLMHYDRDADAYIGQDWQ